VQVCKCANEDIGILRYFKKTLCFQLRASGKTGWYLWVFSKTILELYAFSFALPAPKQGGICGYFSNHFYLDSWFLHLGSNTYKYTKLPPEYQAKTHIPKALNAINNQQ
jgi:hypothetical protein